MKIETKSGFIRDMRRIRNANTRRRVERKLTELRNASNISEVSEVSRIREERGRYYRIRIGAYRLGFMLQGDVVVLYRLLPRDEIYRRFP